MLRKSSFLFSLFFCLTWPTFVDADVWFVAPEGDNTSVGNRNNPFQTIEKAISVVGPGDTIFLRGGVYFPQPGGRFGGGITIRNKSGRRDARIRLFAYQDEEVVIDGADLVEDEWALGLVDSDYWHLRGLKVTNARTDIYWATSGIYLSRSNFNRLENIEVSFCDGTGVVIDHSSGNLLVNCISHHNWDDEAMGGNSDGFAVIHPESIRNRLLECDSFRNGDDGFDLWSGGQTVIEKCRSFENGFDVPAGLPGTDPAAIAGDGNGFKLGGGPGASDAPHLIIQNIAFDSPAIGFDFNGRQGRLWLYNNTAFRNYIGYLMGSSARHRLRNNISFQSAFLEFFEGEVGDDRFNTWNLGIEDPKFKSTDPTKANFLRLRTASPCRDAGTTAPRTNGDSSPDLGAIQFGD